MGFAGVLVVLGPWRGLGGGDGLAQAACLGATLCYRLAFVYLRRVVSGRGLHAIPVATVQVGLGAAIMLVLAPAARHAAGGPDPPSGGRRAGPGRARHRAGVRMEHQRRRGVGCHQRLDGHVPDPAGGSGARGARPGRDRGLEPAGGGPWSWCSASPPARGAWRPCWDALVGAGRSPVPWRIAQGVTAWRRVPVTLTERRRRGTAARTPSRCRSPGALRRRRRAGPSRCG